MISPTSGFIVKFDKNVKHHWLKRIQNVGNARFINKKTCYTLLDYNDNYHELMELFTGTVINNFLPPYNLKLYQLIALNEGKRKIKKGEQRYIHQLYRAVEFWASSTEMPINASGMLRQVRACVHAKSLSWLVHKVLICSFDSGFLKRMEQYFPMKNWSDRFITKDTVSLAKLIWETQEWIPQFVDAMMDAGCEEPIPVQERGSWLLDKLRVL